MNQEIQTKICSKCDQIKLINKFTKDKNRKDGVYPYCKMCRKIFYTNNKPKLLKKSHKRYWDNPVKVQLINKKSRIKHPNTKKNCDKEYRLKNTEKIKITKQNWALKHKKEINLKSRQRRKNDPIYKLIINYRTRLSMLMRNISKSNHTIELLGCTAQEFHNYIEKQFTENMSWNNYGIKAGQWSIDHIIPCDWFKKNMDLLSDLSSQKQCFHYTNCQPMWHIDNIKKGNKINKGKLLYNNNTSFI
jgi:hypothetical protein